MFEFIVLFTVAVPVSALFAKFDLCLPVKSEHELDHLECQLSSEDYLKTMFIDTLNQQKDMGGKSLPITDQLTKIMPTEMWITFNWDGKHNKKKLHVYEEIFSECFRRKFYFNKFFIA